MEGIIKQLSGFSKILFSSFLLVASPWFFFACGLDSYYVMDRSPAAVNIPVYTEDDPAGKYFEFYAAQNSNVGNEEFRFLGTRVYYKIYTSASSMSSNHNSIEAVNDSTNYSAAAERMLNYGYQELNTSNVSVTPLVPSGQEGARVRIRLTNYYEGNASEENWWSNDARIEIRPPQAESATVKYVPRRSLGQSYSFDFGRYGKSEYSNNGINYDAPASGDVDFSGSSGGGKYYVDMYAVAVGRDTTFTTYYSNVEYLGSVTIDATNENN